MIKITKNNEKRPSSLSNRNFQKHLKKFENDEVKLNTNKRITDLEALNKIEKPLLLNPEIDNPSSFFEYIEKEGKLIAKNDNERAKETIEICNLNRTNLRVNRKEIYDNTKLLISYLTLFSLKKKQKIKIKEFIIMLKNKTKSGNKYSALQNQIWNNFEKTIIPHFKNKQLIEFVLIEKQKLNNSTI